MGGPAGVLRPETRFQWLTNYVASAGMNFAAACSGLGLSLLATHVAEFRVREPYFWLAMLWGASGLVAGVASIVFPKLSDRFGRRPMILIGSAGVAVTALLFAFAGAWWQLFAIIVVRACFMSTYWPSLEARIADGAAGREMTRRLAVFGISFCIGTLLGHPVGGFLRDSDPTYRAPFYAGAAVPAFLLILLAAVFRFDRRHDGHRLVPAPGNDLDEEAEERGRRLRPAFLSCAWIADAVICAAGAVLANLFPRFATLPGAEGGLEFSGLRTGLIIAGLPFGMLSAFAVLGRYHFWHYRFRYLVLGQVLCVAGCLAFALYSQDLVLGAATFVFGLGYGIAYISSIYYSLDVEAGRASQSGLHEAMLCFGYSGGMILTGAATIVVRSHRTPYWMCVGTMAVALAVQAAVLVGAKRRLRARAGESGDGPGCA